MTFRTYTSFRQLSTVFPPVIYRCRQASAGERPPQSRSTCRDYGWLARRQHDHLDNGAVITSDDKSLLVGLPLPGTQFVTTVSFSGGTREFVHGAGGLVAPGTIMQTGTAGTYSGQYCLGIGAQ